MASSSQLKFSSACPRSLVIDPKTRIEHLKTLLLEQYWQFQSVSIEKLIHMYETGELGPLTPGKTIYIRNGELLDREFRLDDISEGFISANDAESAAGNGL
ncbi:hypothetical protein AJ80_03426 [Polytolypa hystricis UAMH7299]|uniref:Uncharacterized protein n=1 Tax=Polytolypa hystricis (strain UAMH7299) TaxID=1447883 RepID=A0A2B7YI64_POLH7|nr:hypothetical protein AJ80_03426 [Polytolypa hystricis UAMH7299]